MSSRKKKSSEFTIKKVGKNRWQVITPEGTVRCTVNSAIFAACIAEDCTAGRRQEACAVRIRTEHHPVRCRETGKIYPSIYEAACGTGLTTDNVKYDLKHPVVLARRNRVTFEEVNHDTK